MTSVGVVAKYNPCSSYARLGKPCKRRAKHELCAQKFGPCSDKKYDLWFKRVMEGRIKYFFPKKINLLEVPGTVLVLYHCEKRALVGEAKIVRTTFESGVHRYYFDEFVIYPNQISLSNGTRARRFKQIPAGGRWWLAYISEETLEEIRKFSGLDDRTIDDLKEGMELVREEIKKIPFFGTRKTFDIEAEIGRLIVCGIDRSILDKAKEIVLKESKTRAISGRSLKTLFYAAMYIAYRSAGMTIKLKDISKSEGIGLKQLVSAFSLLKSRLELNLPQISLKTWIRHYSDLLELPEKTTRRAITLTSEISDNIRLKNRSPHSLSATAIYIACIETHAKKSQTEISGITGVSTVTLRNLSKIFFEKAKAYASTSS